MITQKRYLSTAAIAALLATAPMAFAAPPQPVALPNDIVVSALPGTSEAELRNMADKAKCDYVRPIEFCPNFYLFRLKGAAPQDSPLTKAQLPSEALQTAIADLKKTPGILTADPDHLVYADVVPHPLVPLAPPVQAPKKTRATAVPGTSVRPDDPLYVGGHQKGLDLIRMPEAWNLQFGVRPVVVGVGDTGIDVGHPDFNDAAGVSRIIAARNFTSTNPNDVQDVVGHGTHVAGTIAATVGNTLGVASVAGWNRGGMDVKLHIARVLDANGFGTSASIGGGINYLVDQNVDVINLSLGGYVSDPLQQQAIARAIAANITVVASAGNLFNNNTLVPHYPSGYPGVIEVSATTLDDVPKLASYSNFGASVAIAAPGGDGGFTADTQVWSTWARNVPSDVGVVGYNAISGTSMASPHVAGAAAVLIANGATRNPAVIKQLLQSNALPLPDEDPDPTQRKYGAGFLDVYSALVIIADPPFSIDFTNDVVDEGRQYSHQVLPFQVRVQGVSKKPAPGGARLEIRTATFPPSTVLTFLSDTAGGFTIPALQAGQPKAQPFVVSVPEGAPLVLNPGRYRAVVIENGQEVSSKFFEIVARNQPIGRTMFSVPFKAREARDPITGLPVPPEQAILGTQVSYTLARYNPLRLPSDFDYAIFQSAANGRKDAAASFSATAPDGSPLTYDITDPNTSIAPVGLGYWLNLDQGVVINPAGSTVSNPVAIRLFSANGGWNMIGAPFSGSAGWGSVSVLVNNQTLTLADAIKTHVISSALIGYDQGDYIFQIYPAGTLEPFNGYWVRAYQDCTLVIAPSTTTRAVATSRAALPPANGWRARLTANVAGDRDGQNYFGQLKDASNDNDIYDIPKPPSGSGHAYVRFLTGPEGRAVSNAFDMRSLNDNKAAWNAAVSTDRPNADVTLSWDGLANVPNRGDLLLTDVATGQTVNMRNRSSYTFRSGEAGSTRMFKIALSPRATAGPLTISNVMVAPGGRGVDAGMTVRFNTNREAEVIGTVKALNGTVIGTLTGTTRATPSGTATLRWDGRSRSGTAVPPGAYLISITAKATNGDVATFTQPVQSIR